MKKDNRLKLRYDNINGLHGIVPVGEETRADLYYLFSIFEPSYDKTVLKELEKRGYDSTTFKFEIKKKE